MKNNLKHFRKIWDSEKNAWLMEHKTMPRKEAYKLFLKTFPDAFDVTETAFYNQRSRIGATSIKAVHGSTLSRPLYSEQLKKGYVRIKVAMPNVWKTKSRWVYEETHPWEDFSERSNYIFLNGNNRDFNPANIERVPIKLMGIFNQLGGCEVGNPELTRLRVLQAKLKWTELNAGEKLGLCNKVKVKNSKYSYRYFKKDKNTKVRASRLNAPNFNEKSRVQARKRYARIKSDPVQWKIYAEKTKIRNHRWYEKNKERIKYAKKEMDRERR